MMGGKRSCEGGVVDMRSRPPLPEFRAYFDPSRLAALSVRSGAAGVPRAFVEGSMELYFEEMAEAGITTAVVHGRNSPASFMGTRFNEAFIANETIADLQTRYPGRFVGYAGIDASGTVHDAVAETRRCLTDLGLRGIFLEPGRALGANPDDPRLFPIYEQCLRFGAAVNIMTGPYAGPDIGASDPVCIDRLATRYPELTIICGHGCWPYVQQIIAVAFKHRNVHVSPDMYMFAPGGGAYVEAANGMLRGQMLFGSAYPLRPMPQSVNETRNLGILPGALDQYLHANATGLLATPACATISKEET
ncbi:MAG: amidohydrolase family protein [Betaproteobacteria bacterium]